MNTPRLNRRQRPVVDLPTLEGWKTELTSVTGFIPRWFTRTQTVIHPSTNPTLHGRESNLRPVNHKSDCPTHYTTKPPVLSIATSCVMIWTLPTASANDGHFKRLRSCKGHLIRTHATVLMAVFLANKPIKCSTKVPRVKNLWRLFERYFWPVSFPVIIIELG